MAGFFRKIALTLEMIRFEHSVFALPFALVGALLALREDGFQRPGIVRDLLWIVVAMVAARSAAMAFNRLVDARIDAKNPRTAMRHLPAGLLGHRFAMVFTGVACAVFIFAAAMLNPTCLWLSPVALALLFGYSYTKRFTSMSHVVLGICLGAAPAAAWIAIRGSLDSRVLMLTAAVALWTAGFDIIYSCQDYEFDRSTGLWSIPRQIGIARALAVAGLMHVCMIVCLLFLVRSFDLSWFSIAGVAAVAAVLVWEHSLVKPGDLSRVNAAFFTANGWVSVLFCLFWTADIALSPRGVL